MKMCRFDHFSTFVHFSTFYSSFNLIDQIDINLLRLIIFKNEKKNSNNKNH